MMRYPIEPDKKISAKKAAGAATPPAVLLTLAGVGLTQMRSRGWDWWPPEQDLMIVGAAYTAVISAWVGLRNYTKKRYHPGR